MKRIFALFIAAAISVGASAATLVPIQLLNPAGSSSGQAIVSTGASSAPAWGGVGVNGIAAIAANTVLANATASSASPTSFAMPSCSTSVSALNWTTSTGFTCNTGLITAATVSSTYAPIANPTFTGTVAVPNQALNTNSTAAASTAFVQGTLASPPSIGSTTPGAGAFTTLSTSGLISPTSTVGIKGTTAADSAQAGSIGEYFTATASGVSLTTGTTANVTSISLAAGDWDISGMVAVLPAGSTVISNSFGGSSTTSATVGALGTYWELAPGATATGAAYVQAIPTSRINVSSTTTVYLVANAAFTVSTCTASGVIRARRIR